VRRRAFIAGAGATLATIAGCGGPSDVTLELTPVEDEELAERTTERVSGGDAELVVDAADGGATTTARREPPVVGAGPVAVEETYYRVGWEVTGGGRVRTYEILLAPDPHPPTPAGGRVALEELPAVDRPVFDLEDAVDALPPFEHAVAATYTDAEVARSLLVPTPDHGVVVADGTAYRVAVEGPSVGERLTYRYDATVLAEGVAAMAAYIEERYQFTLTGRTPAERRLLEQAAGGEYTEESTAYSGTMAGLVRHIRNHEALESNYPDGVWLVEYDDRPHLAELDFGPRWGGGGGTDQATPSWNETDDG
jgi:hypothetical protein